MAGPYYVRSTDGSDASDGLTWANAKATLAGAFAVMAAGERVWVSQVHAETQGSAMTLTSPGTAAAPCEVLCGDDAAEPPTALATTGTISVTGAFSISFAGYCYTYGITYTAGSGASTGTINFGSSSAWWWQFDTSRLKLGGSSSTARINIGANSGATPAQLLELENTVIEFTSVGQGIVPRCRVLWTNTPSAIAGTVPTTLFIPTSTPAADVQVTGVDLSAAGSGKNLVDVSANKESSFLFVDCKLGASVAITTGSVAGQGGISVRLVNCDSADTNYRYLRQTYQGTITQETTIVKTGGASDGTTTVSRKMVTTANSKFFSPLVDDWGIPIWNETLSAITLTLPIITDNVTLTDAEAWIEVEYLGTSGFPLGNYISDRAADILATPANQASDSSTWTTTGLGTPLKQKLNVTFTPAKKGLIRARVMLAKASTTMYYDPLLLVT